MKVSVWQRPPLRDDTRCRLLEAGLDYVGETDDADIIYTWTEKCELPTPSIVVCNTTDTSHIDTSAKIVKLDSSMLANVWSTAEHTLLLMLLIAKSSYSRRDKPNYELRGKRLRILGNGRVASQVSVLAEAIGMIITDGPADMLTVHVPATQHRLLSATTLAAIQPRWIINTSRETVIDEQDVLAYCVQHNAIYATDFPPWNTNKWPIGHLYCTEHVAGYTVEGLAATERIVTDNLLTYLQRKEKEALPCQQQ